MLGNIAAVALFVIAFAVFILWIRAIVNSDGTCDPGEDCEGCPFPCDNHERKRRKRKK